MTSLVLLDTDTLSLLRRGHPQVSPRAATYIVQQARLTFTALTRYEVVRGFRAIGAHRQLQVVEQFYQQCQILLAQDRLRGIWEHLAYGLWLARSARSMAENRFSPTISSMP